MAEKKKHKWLKKGAAMAAERKGNERPGRAPTPEGKKKSRRETLYDRIK